MLAAAVLAAATLSAQLTFGFVSGAHESAAGDLCGALAAAEAVSLDEDPFGPDVLDPRDFNPEYVELHNELIGTAAGTCGWPEVRVVSSEYEYSFEDEPTAATTYFVLDNRNGQERHKLMWFEFTESALEMSLEEILEQDDWSEYLIYRGGLSVNPGSERSGVINLTEGKWGAVCTVLVGTTSDVLDQMLESGEVRTDGDDPHWRHGQLAEFELGA